MKNVKKYGVFIALTAILLTTALVIGCIQPIDGYSFNSGKTSGKGNFMISFGNGGRTVLPTAASAEQFYVRFLGATPYEEWFTATVAPGGTVSSLRIDLPTGNYTGIEVFALNSEVEIDPSAPTSTRDDAIDAVIAYRTLATAVAVDTAGLATPAMVAFNGDNSLAWVDHTTAPAIIGTGTGKFEFEVDDTGLSGVTLTGQTVTITGRTDTFTDTVNVADGSADLPPGIYTAIFNLTDGSKTASFKQIVHIYKNLTSSYKLENLSDGYFVTTATPQQPGVDIAIVMPGGVDDPIKVTGVGTGTPLPAVVGTNVALVNISQEITITASGGTGNYTWSIINGTETDISSLAETNPADGSVLVLNYAMFFAPGAIINAGAHDDVDMYTIFVEDSDNHGAEFTISITRP